MKKIFIFACIFLISHIQADEANIRGMTIFLDASEGFSAEPFAQFVSAYLFEALNQQTAPIIASSHVLKNIAAHIKPQNWIVKKISEKLYLLIPSNLLQLTVKTDIELALGLKINSLISVEPNRINNPATYAAQNNPQVLSQEFIQKIIIEQAVFIPNAEYYKNKQENNIPEWVFFMAGHGSQTVSAYNDVDSAIRNFLKQNYPAKAASITDAVKQKADVLAINGMIQQFYNKFEQLYGPLDKLTKTSASPIYTIIAGLTIKDMQTFLDFLDKKIHTKFFMFTSCYSGGENLAALYKSGNEQSFLQKTYSYTIASAATTDAKVTVKRLRIIENNKTITEQTLKLPQFFNAFKVGPPYNFLEITQYVNPFEDKIIPNKTNITLFTNIPSIKLPGIEWTNIIDIPGKIVSIGKTLARARGTKSLDISTFFARTKEKIYPQALMLYAPLIKFPIKLTLNPDTSDKAFKNPPAFISMIIGNAVHEIAEIQAPEFSFSSIFDAFFTLKALSTQKIFFIKKITALNNINLPGQPANKPILLTDVYIFNRLEDPLQKGTLCNGIYFTYNDKFYTKTWTDLDQIPAAGSLQNFATTPAYNVALQSYIAKNRGNGTFAQLPGESLLDVNLDEFAQQLQTTLLTTNLYRLEADLRALAKSLR
ncbi:MAG: hypothetical protein WC707_05860 [Candidatus Babeliaceae bacterium]|jgi:hypothetical protein